MSDPVKRPAEAAMESESQKRLKLIFNMVDRLRSECLGPTTEIPLNVISDMLLSEDFDPAAALEDWNERCEMKSISPEPEFDCAGEVVGKSKSKPGEAIGDPTSTCTAQLMNTEKPVVSDDDDGLGDEDLGSWSSHSDTPWVPPTTCFICHKDTDHIPINCPKFPRHYPIKNLHCSLCWKLNDHVAENCPNKEKYKQMPDGSYVRLNPNPCKSSPQHEDMSDDDFGF